MKSCAVSEPGRLMALGGSDGIIEVWDYSKMKLDETLKFQADGLFMVH